MVRVLLIDDYGLFRESLGRQLARLAEIEWVYEAAGPAPALRILEDERPDVVLMAIETPGADVFEAVRAMRRIDSGCRIIFLGWHECDSCVEKALEVGANGYVVKSDGLAVLMQAIETVCEGGFFYSESIRRRLSVDDGRLILARPRSAAIATLTLRERELLRYLGEGVRLKEAAAAMGISYKTADNQRTSLMRKLNIHDRVKLARFAVREGWVAPV